MYAPNEGENEDDHIPGEMYIPDPMYTPYDLLRQKLSKLGKNFQNHDENLREKLLEQIKRGEIDIKKIQKPEIDLSRLIRNREENSESGEEEEDDDEDEAKNKKKSS